jgi:hypothetical protein
MFPVCGGLMSYILSSLNFVLMIAMIFIFRADMTNVLGGTSLLFILVPVFIFLSIWFKQIRLELNLLMIGIFSIFTWQGLLYLETRGMFSHSVILVLLLATEVIVYAVQVAIIAKALLPNEQSHDPNLKIKENIAKSILIRLYLYNFAGLSFSYLFGLAINFAQQTYLVRQAVMSSVAVGLFWAISSNIAAYISVNKIDDRYFQYVYNKRSINTPKIKRIAVYVFSTLLLLGFLLEMITRKRAVVYLETLSFILSAMVLIWKVFKFEANNEVEIAEPTSLSSIAPKLDFYLKYVFIFAIGGTFGFILFLFFLRSYQPLQ